MKTMPRYLKRTLSFLLIFIAAWLLYFEWLVPGYVGLHFPTRWRDPAVFNNRQSLQGKLGNPASSADMTDEWHVKNGGEHYVLQVDYDSAGAAKNVRAYCRYEVFFLDRNYQLMDMRLGAP